MTCPEAMWEPRPAERVYFLKPSSHGHLLKLEVHGSTQLPDSFHNTLERQNISGGQAMPVFNLNGSLEIEKCKLKSLNICPAQRTSFDLCSVHFCTELLLSSGRSCSCQKLFFN